MMMFWFDSSLIKETDTVDCCYIFDIVYDDKNIDLQRNWIDIWHSDFIESMNVNNDSFFLSVVQSSSSYYKAWISERNW
jgi:hypothetical protein